MEAIYIKPENTFVIAVGIDVYPKMGSDYRLSNAALEAIQFVEWLIEKGIKADQIKLFISENSGFNLSDGYGNRLESLDPEGIRSTILEQPFKTASGENLLLVYWAGHGSSDSAQHQLLWDQNYNRDNDRLVFDLEDLRLALRSVSWEAFPHQIIFVNACARDHGNDFNRHQFQGLGLKDQLKRKQYTISAASPGQTAIDGGRTETSPLFAKLLQTLKETTRNNWPIRMTEIGRTICDWAVNHPQTPRIEEINWNGGRLIWNGDKLTGLITSKISKLSIDFDELVSVYKMCVKDALPVNSVREIIMHLEAENSSGERSTKTTVYGSVLDFALRIIKHFNCDEFDQQLTKFFDQEAEYDKTILTKARRIIDDDYRLPVPPLNFSFTPGEAEDTFTYFLHDGTGFQWIKDDGTVSKGESLEDAFRRVVLKNNDKLGEHSDRLNFHFFLNFEKLSLSLHDWKDPTRLGDKRLEHYYRVDVRCLERAKGASDWNYACGRWQSKANELKKRKSLTKLRIKWIDMEDDLDDATEEYECIGFNYLPSPVLLRQALDEGLPFLLWPRQESAEWDQCRKELETTTINGTIDDAPSKFPAVRRKHKEVPFAILWDDPDHNPYAGSPKQLSRTPAAFTDID